MQHSWKRAERGVEGVSVMVRKRDDDARDLREVSIHGKRSQKRQRESFSHQTMELPETQRRRESRFQSDRSVHVLMVG